MAIVKKAGAGAGAGNAAAPPANMVSLKPSDQQQGGILDDMDVTFKELSFVEYDYGGKADKPTLALLVIMTDADGTDHEQYFSAGDTSRFQPSKDGLYVVAVGNAKGLSTTSNAAILMRSIVDQGFPEDHITGKASDFAGMNAHVIRVPQPKRHGLIQAEGERERTVLTVSKINQLPWEKPGKTGPRPTAGAKTAAKPSASATTQAATNGESELSEEAQGILLQVLEAKGGAVKKSGIAAGSFKLLTGNSNRGEILKLLTDDDFLGTPDLGWEYDGQTITSVS